MSDLYKGGFVLLFSLLIFFGAVNYARAEDYIQISGDETTEVQEEPPQEVPVSTVEPVPVSIDYDALAQAIQDAQPETTEAPAEEVPAVDYTAKLDALQTTLNTIQQNTQPATPETAQSAFEKPFEDYSVSEVILTILAIMFVFAIVIKIFRG